MRKQVELWQIAVAVVVIVVIVGGIWLLGREKAPSPDPELGSEEQAEAKATHEKQVGEQFQKASQPQEAY